MIGLNECRRTLAGFDEVTNLADGLDESRCLEFSDAIFSFGDAKSARKKHNRLDASLSRICASGRIGALIVLDVIYHDSDSLS